MSNVDICLIFPLLFEKENYNPIRYTDHIVRISSVVFVCALYKNNNAHPKIVL